MSDPKPTLEQLEEQERLLLLEKLLELRGYRSILDHPDRTDLLQVELAIELTRQSPVKRSWPPSSSRGNLL